METIKSFTVNHKRLLPGVYVSRKDSTGHDVVTTFDIRMTRPNFEPVMNTAEIHTLEHLGATSLRNHEEWSNKIFIYFELGMGCQYPFYLLLAGDYESEDIISLLREMFEFVCHFEGEIPGAAPEACGNYLDQNLPMAKYLAEKYLEHVF